MNLNILFWDIDGTLIRTSRAGLFAFNQAADEQWGTKVDFHDIRTSGMTDYSIGAQIIQKITGRKPLSQEISALTDRYEELLPSHLAQREGRVMPSVFTILDELKQRPDYQLLLLTGNSRHGAEIKLKYFDLMQYFDFDQSAFCECALKRTDISELAVRKLSLVYEQMSDLRIFVIGDTPNDIHCGKDIQAYTIGIATGNYSVEQLSAYSPWWAVAQLPSVDAFTKKIAQVE